MGSFAPLALVSLLVLGVAGATREMALGPEARDLWQAGRVELAGDGDRRWVRLTTDGHARPSLLVAAAPAAPIDLGGHALRVRLRVDRVDRLGGLELRASSDGMKQNVFAIAIPLFADPEFGLLMDGAWSTISLSFGEARRLGRPDLSRIDSIGLYVIDGGQGPLRLDWGELARFRQPEQGVASLTFDDGYDEHMSVAAVLMAAHGFRGTAYVIPQAIGRPGYLSEPQMLALARRYGWDVAAHHATPFTAMGSDELESEVREVQRYLDEHDLGDGSAHLAFPLGKHDAGSILSLVRTRFRSARLAGGGPETLPPGDFHRLRVMNVTNETPPSEIGAAARRAREHGEWLILMFHYLEPEAPSALHYRVADFEAALDEIERSGIAVRTVSEVWRAFAPQAPAARAQESRKR